MASEDALVKPLHPEVMSPAQGRLLHRLGGIASERGFYLAGGTAIAIYLGHRAHRRALSFTVTPPSNFTTAGMPSARDVHRRTFSVSGSDAE